MTIRPHVLHLVDDTTPGGVTRVLEHIRSCPLMARNARHSVQTVSRASGLPRCDADMIVSHLSLSWRRLPALIAFRAGHAAKPIIHVEHSYTEAFVALNVASRLRFFTLLRTAYALFDKVVAVSAVQGDWLLRRGLVAADRMTVISPVVPLQGFRALTAPRGAPRVIGAIGRLHRQKGFDVLIEAFRSAPGRDLALHIHGTGPEEGSLRELAAGDPRIRFFGHSDRPEAVMQSVDVVAMPSRWEAFGLVALEARAAGRPVVCTRVDGLTTSAGPDATYVQDHTVKAWTDALMRATHGKNTPPSSDRAGSAEREFAAAWGGLIREKVAADVAWTMIDKPA